MATVSSTFFLIFFQFFVAFNSENLVWGDGEEGIGEGCRILVFSSKVVKWLVGYVTCIYFKDNSVAFLENMETF